MKGLGGAGLADLVRLGLESIRAQPLRSALAASSMAVAVATVILVATVAATGSEFVLAQIEGVGSNLVYAYYEAGGNVSAAESDYVTLADVEAVRVQLGSLASSVAGVTTSWDSITVSGNPVQIRILGSDQEYRAVRNLRIHAGRFLDRADLESRAKVCLLTPELARTVFGTGPDPLGKSLKVHGLDFLVVGLFSESVETFGQSEVSDSSVLVPYTVLQYFQEVERVDPLYVAVRSQEEVEQVARLVRNILESRHRPGALYRVDSLAAVLDSARRILLAMSLAMGLVATITLLASGIFIMNLMLMAVSERTVEIGIRKAVGATLSAVRLQFLAEAVLLAVLGCAGGTVLGLGLPWLVSQIWPGLPVRIPGLWVGLGLVAAPCTGALAGLLPAVRASRLAPAEALRHE